MSTPQQNPAFVTLLSKILGFAEVVAILLSVGGLIFKAMHWTYGNELLMIGMSSLAGVYFLRAFQAPPAGTPQPTQQTPEKKGFIELLAVSIVPKLGWIAMAVCLDGFLFALLHLSGAAEMLLIGTSTLLASIAVAFVAVSTNASKYPRLIGFLYRGVPVFLLTAYAFYNLSAVGA